MAAFKIDFEFGVWLKEKSRVWFYQKMNFSKVFEQDFVYSIGTSILKITSDGCFGIHHVFSYTSKQASITSSVTSYQHHSYLNFFLAVKPKFIYETSYSLCTLKKMFPKNRETPWKVSAKVKFLALLKAVSLFIVSNVFKTLSNI